MLKRIVSRARLTQFLLYILLLSIFFPVAPRIGVVYSDFPTDKPLIYVDPETIEGVTYGEFTIRVRIFNVTILFALDIQFSWNTTILEYVDHTVYIPVEDHLDGVLHKPVSQIRDNVDETASMPGAEVGTTYWIAYNSYGSGTGSFNGSGTVFDMTFRVKSRGECPLHFTKTTLVDKWVQAITHEARDGSFVTDPAGPRMNNLFIKYYNGSSVLFDALKNGEVDLTDITLQGVMVDEVFNDTNIQAAMSPSYGVFGFDFNNNATTPTYPNYTNPTAYKEFRQGIACLVNKTQIVNGICNYSQRIDTPFARPCFDWWVDWSVSQYDSQGNLLGNYPYEYNSTLAAYYFDHGGFVEGDTVNPYYDEDFPGSTHYLRKHPETDADLDSLDFYIRNDSITHFHLGRLQAGRLLRDNLRKLGIPVNAIEANYSICVQKVMREGDYHIYTMGWTITPRNCLSIYTSDYIYEGFMTNYPQFRNATYDSLVKQVESFLNPTVALEAALDCQKILIEEAVCVWVFSPSWIFGYRNIHGVVSARGHPQPDGIDNRWTFLTSHLGENASRTWMNYGLSSQPNSLNVITDYYRTSCFECFERIYDTLLSFNPYDKLPDLGEVMPWMAEGWDVGEWESPYNPSVNLTKLTFYLRDGIRWHDGVELNSTDVEFTIEYLKGLGSLVDSSLESMVYNIHHVIAPDARTVVVFENVSSRWTLYDVGTLPILPKHVFQDISNVTGYTPGANEGHPVNETLVGSGAWKYVFYNSSMLWLEANRDYFMETPPDGEVDFRYDWELGCWAVDALDATMVGEAFGARGDSVPSAKWESGCDIAKDDCKVDLFDVVTVADDFNITWGESARLAIAEPALPTDTAIYVEPPESPVLVGQNLTVHVKMDNLTSLSGLQFKLNYDNTKLEWLDVAVSEIFGTYTFEVKKEANQTTGLVWVSLVSLDQTQINGNATVATITFNATKPSGSILNLWNTKLARYGALGSACQPMPHRTLDRGIVVGVSTPTGTNVVVKPAEDAQLTFASTNSTGVTTLDIIPPPSTEFASVVCCDITTTAIYSGDVTVQFDYDPTGMTLEDEQAMKIWLWNDIAEVWTDITTSVDTDENIVYGLAPHLSIFGVTHAIGLEGDIEGDVTVGYPTSPPNPPPSLTVLKYYDITCESSTGPITIRLEYDDSIIPPEGEMFVQIWLWSDVLHVWTDITTQVDTSKNLVFGESPHLSIFGVTAIPPSAGIGAANAECSKTVVGRGYSTDIEFVVDNLDYFTKNSVDLILYGNSTVINVFSVTLNPIGQTGASATLSFTWETDNCPIGNYTLFSCGRVIGWVVVTLPGDVDGDFKVFLYDAVKLLVCYGIREGEDGYVCNYDIDGDGRIFLYDAVILCSRYGQEYP